MNNRHDDIDFGKDPIPEGLMILEGKNLMISARCLKIPFGLAHKRTKCGNSFRQETVGIVILKTHHQPMLDFMAARAEKNRKARERTKHLTSH